MSISGNTVVVGLPGPIKGGDSAPGQAYIFQKRGEFWTKQHGSLLSLSWALTCLLSALLLTNRLS